MKRATKVLGGPAPEVDPPEDQPASDLAVHNLPTFVAEVGVLALALGTVAGFIQLFDGWDFFAPLALVSVLSWATAVGLRRAGTHIAISTLVHTIAGLVALGVIFVPESTILGALLPRTFSDAWLEVTSSLVEIRTLVPPVDATTGFLVAIAAGIWALVLYADTAAIRVDAVLQAAAPFVIIFVSIGIPARGSGRTVAIACFLAAMAIYAVATQFSRYSQLRWADRSPSRGARSIARSGATIALVGTVVALVAGASLPDQSRRIDLRRIGQGPGERTVVSPFVGVTALLGPRSNSEMFRVRSESPSYWRLTSLGSFDEDRNIWVSHGTYSPIEDQLARNTAGSIPSTRLRQDYKVGNLSGPWLPAAFEPGRISGDVTATYDQVSSSLINDRDTSRGLTYQVDSFIPNFSSVSELGLTDGSGNSALDPDLLTVPEISFRSRRIFDSVTGQTRDPYQRMVLLQDWFRTTFAYDESVDFGNVEDPLTEFIVQRRGFCQQFSSTFALLARHAGLPSRVAVGFTQGDATTPDSPGPDGSSDIEYVVRGRHAHAWPEVFFADIGWVPFEPTPGRGNPATTTYTGIPGAQASPPAESATTTVPPSSTLVPPPTQPSTPPSTNATDPELSDADSPPGNDLTSPRSLITIGALALLLCGVALVARSKHLGRRGLGDTSASANRIRDSWQHCVRSLATVGISVQPAETPLEFAGRAGTELERLAADHDGQTHVAANSAASQGPRSDLRLLAEAETFRRYGQVLDEEASFEGRTASSVTSPEIHTDPSSVELAATRISTCTKQLSGRLGRLERLIRS